ncbi:MAG TPA: ATP-dependent helicase, partial [Epsilonproteobacteria bacterium]|nr:ATP-dependent helicase [Campylobacterota bacterium]
MIEIEIAGAGAGKTFSLAQKIIDIIRSGVKLKRIYAVTFTNSAKKKIYNEVLKHNGFIPANVFIETVHGLFLNELIFPFFTYSIQEKYNQVS